MVSRKRNKGKERKAKKAEKAANEAEIAWRRWAHGKDENDNKCDHGYGVTIPDVLDHPIFSFMQSFMEMNLEGIDGVYILLECNSLLDGHPEIWNNKSHREMAMKILLRIGTNMILFNNKRSPPTPYITFASRIIANSFCIINAKYFFSFLHAQSAPCLWPLQRPWQLLPARTCDSKAC